MIKIATLIFAISILFGCENNTKISSEDMEKYNSVSSVLLNEKRISIANFSTYDEGILWDIGVIPNGGNEKGYAGFVCALIKEEGLNIADQNVQTFDVREYANEQKVRDTAKLVKINCYEYISRNGFL